MSKRPASVVIDPITMGILTKISAGSSFTGDNVVDGGLMLEGQCNGKLVVNGILVVWEGAILRGDVTVSGDAYIFGKVGSKGDADTKLTVHGELHLSSKSEASGRIRYGKLAWYTGAQVNGAIEPLEDEATPSKGN